MENEKDFQNENLLNSLNSFVTSTEDYFNYEGKDLNDQLLNEMIQQNMIKDKFYARECNSYKSDKYCLLSTFKYYEEDFSLKQPECNCLQYSKCGNYLAAGYSDGSVKIFNNECILTQQITENPITCLKWKNNNLILIISSSNGIISNFFLSEDKLGYKLKFLSSVKEDSSVNSIDISKCGNYLLSGGNDFTLKLYDDRNKVIIHSFDNITEKAHTNRIFCVKFIPNYNLCLSGGWDKEILFHDFRESIIFI